MRFPMLGVALALASAPALAATPQVKLAQGAVSGVQQDGIQMFRGIPFAGDTGGDQHRTTHRRRSASAANFSPTSAAMRAVRSRAPAHGCRFPPLAFKNTPPITLSLSKRRAGLRQAQP